MSQENVELVKAVFRAWDEEGVEGMLKLFHEDIDYLPLEEGAPVHGHDAMRRYFSRWMEPWKDFHVSPTEFLVSGDHVVNGVAMKGRGRSSGLDVTMEYWQVWLIRDGKAAHWDEYPDRAEALEAVGLRE